MRSPQWRRGREDCPQNFWAVGKLSENLSVQKFLFKNAKLRAEEFHFGEIYWQN